MNTTLAGWLAEKRTVAGFAQQAEFANALGVKQQTVSRWETGTSFPRISEAPKIARLLGIPLDEVLRACGRIPESVATVSFDRPWPLHDLGPKAFERFCTNLVEGLCPPNTSVSLYGREGDKQSGIDITAQLPDGTVNSFQCKRTSSFGPRRIQKAIEDHQFPSTRKTILLSGLASPQARDEIRKHDDWQLWDREDITRRIRKEISLAQQQVLVDIFFPGQRFALLGEPEPGPWRTPDAFFGGWLDADKNFSHVWRLRGQEEPLAALHRFLASKDDLALLLVGNGGTGKTRLLKEFTDRVAKTSTSPVLWFLSKEPLTAKSLESLGTGPKLLVCDDGHERDDLALLFDYVVNPVSNARVIVGLREYGLDRLLQQARSIALHRVPRIRLQRLTKSQSEALAREALQHFRAKDNFVEELAQYTQDCPLATVLGAKVLAKTPTRPHFLGSQEIFRAELMRHFVSTIVDDISAGLDRVIVRRVLASFALLQPVDSRDDGVTSAVAKFVEIPPSEVSRITRRLQEAGVLFARGPKNRVAPDLLGDFLIEEEFVAADGRSNGGAEVLFDLVPGAYVEHILVSLGRLDWQKRTGDTRNSPALNALWARLKFDDYTGTHFRAAAAVAFYQPYQALQFATRVVAAGHTNEAVTTIIRNAAYNVQCVEQCCELLWKIGKDDESKRNRHPSHGIRLLTEMAEPGPYKPTEYIDRVVDFALKLVRQPDGWGHLHTPLDILEGGLAVEGHTTESTATAMTMRPFWVAPGPVKAIRRKIVTVCVELLSHPDAGRATRAAQILHSALRLPMGQFGCKFPESVNGEWDIEFCETLHQILRATQSKRLSPVVLTSVAQSVSWHANYYEGPTTAIAKSILSQLDSDLRSKTVRTLIDGWGNLTRKFEPDTCEEVQTQELRSLTSDLLSVFQESAQLRAFFEGCLEEIATTLGGNGGSPHLLLNEVMRTSPRFCQELIAHAYVLPDARTSLFAGLALGHLLDADYATAQKVVRDVLAEGDGPRLIWVAEAYRRFSPKGKGYTDVDQRAFDLAVTSNQLGVHFYGSGLVHQVSLIDSRRSLELILKANLGLGPQVAHEYLMWLSSSSNMPVERLTKDEVVAMLNKFARYENLDEYWIQEFLRKALSPYPWEVIEFLIHRIEYGVTVGDYSFRPVTAGPYRHVTFNLMERRDAVVWISKIFDWALAHCPGQPLAWRGFADLVEALFAPFNEHFISAVEGWALFKTYPHLEVALAALGQAGHDCIFQFDGFVTRLLSWAESLGKEPLDEAVSMLYTTTWRGSRVGAAGQPFPQDLDLKAKAEKKLVELPRFEPAYRLYEQVLDHANDAIASQLAFGERLRTEEED